MTPDGRLIMQYGRFHEVVPPNKIVFTNKCEDRDGCESETIVTVSLTGKDQGTELSIQHDLMPNESCRQRAQKGWVDVLDNLERELKK